MRSYNFVFVLTPTFEGWQVRIWAMDFDQRSYNGRRTFYLPRCTNSRRSCRGRFRLVEGTLRVSSSALGPVEA